MKSILVAGDDPRNFEAVLATAWLVAERFDSYVEGVAVQTLTAPITTYAGFGGVAVTTLESLEAEDLARAGRLKEAFREFAGQRAMPDGVHQGDKPRQVVANWPVDEPIMIVALGERGRVFDLIVLGRSGEGVTGADTPVMESALFDSGRPVLIAPEKAPPSIGSRMLIAWNGASESARAVALALPFLSGADQVLVLEVEGGSVLGPNAQDLRNYLARQGIKSHTKTVAPEGSETGQVILDQAAAMGADLIVKGAYTHSRLRQMIFGGATKSLLTASPVPVLMAH